MNTIFESFGRARMGSFLARIPIWFIVFFIFAIMSTWVQIPLTGDQKVYLNTVYEMWGRVENSKLSVFDAWAEPYMFGEVSFYKPPLLYWLSLLSLKIFGFGLWQVFLPITSSVAVTVYCIDHIFRILKFPRSEIVKVTGRKGPILSGVSITEKWGRGYGLGRVGILFATSLGSALFGRVYQMEMLILAIQSISFLFFVKFLAGERGQRNRYYWMWAMIFAGLLSIVKSPVYSVFQVFSFYLFLFFSGEWDIFLSRRFWLAQLLGILVGISWYLSIYKWGHFSDLWEFFIVRENFSKRGGNGGSSIDLWVNFAQYTFPWILLLPWLLAMLRVRMKGLFSGVPRHLKVYMFTLAIALPQAVFFSFYPYKVGFYLFPILLPFFILIGFVVDTYSRNPKFLTYIESILLFHCVGLSIVFFLLVQMSLLTFDDVVIPVSVLLALVLISVIRGFRFFFGRPLSIDSRTGSFAFVLRRILLVPSSTSFGRMPSVRFFILVIVLSYGVRLLGEKDLFPLRDHLANMRTNTALTFLDSTREIWHERGYLGFVFTDTQVGTVAHFSDWFTNADKNKANLLYLYPHQLQEISNELTEAVKSKLSFTEIERLRPRREIHLHYLIDASLKCFFQSVHCVDHHHELFRKTIVLQKID